MNRLYGAYGGALYVLAREEGLEEELMEQLTHLQQAMEQEPDFLKLLSSPSLTKQQRCRIVEDSFQNWLHPYVVRFLKILICRGYGKHMAGCFRYFQKCYERDHNILPATAVTAVAMSPAQKETLTAALGRMTGKTVTLHCRVEPQCLGGVRLEFDGQQLDSTLRSKLDALEKLLKSAAL